MRDTRTALLDSAENAAKKKGYDGFSYADLAADVGIRKASIHHHFPTKADLTKALIDRYIEAFKAALMQIEKQHETAGARLKNYISLYRNALDDSDQLCLCVILSAGRDSLRADIIQSLDAFHDHSETWLKAIFTQGAQDKTIIGITSPEREASSCLALVEGAQLRARASGDMAQFDDATSLLDLRCEAAG